MRKIIKYIINTLLFASCLTFFSCNNLFQDDEKLQSVNTINSENKVKITANIDLENNSRKAVPDYSLYDRLNYKLTATCNTDDSYSTEMPFDDPEIELELIVANWSFELTAYDAGNTPILRSSENTNIDITEDTELNFKMVGLANGSLEYKFLIGEFTEEELEEELGGEELNFTTLRNPVLVFEFYKYKGSIQETLLHKIEVTDTPDLVITEGTKQTYDVIDDKVQMIETPITIVHRKDSFSLPEGTYFVVCKKADRSPKVNEETVTEDDLKFFFQELVEIKSGLTTTSKYAVTSASPEYKITFHTNSGSFDTNYLSNLVFDGISSYKYTYNPNYNDPSAQRNIKKSSILPEPEREGYLFEGWYYDKECISNPVTYDYAYHFDSNNKQSIFAGNIDVYAKWSNPVEFVDVMLYSKGGYFTPKITSDWNTALTDSIEIDVEESNYVSYDDGVRVGSDIFAIYDYVYNNSEHKYGVFKNGISFFTDPEIFSEKVGGNSSIVKRPLKITYDSYNNKIVVLVERTNPTNTSLTKYSYIIASLDGSDYQEIEYGASENEFVSEGIDSRIYPAAFSVNNNLVLTEFYYDGDLIGKYNKLYISELGNGNANLIKEVPIDDFLGDSLRNFEAFKQYAKITDFAYTDYGLIASVRVCYDNIVNVGGISSIPQFGLLVKFDTTSYTATPLFNPVSKHEISYTASYDNTEYRYDYYGISNERDISGLVGPTKILAVKPKELVFVDEGLFLWSDFDCGGAKDMNRIVVYNLEENSISFVKPISQSKLNINFDYGASGSLPSGFTCVSTNMIGS